MAACRTCEAEGGYSYLNDSIGSFSDARFAGEYPNITPTAADTPKEINIEKKETTVIIPAICSISFAIITPNIILNLQIFVIPN